MKTTGILILFYVFFQFNLKAQDAQFSNINQVQFLLNPAFTALNTDLKADLIYRNQWKNTQTKFESSAFAFSSKINLIKRESYGKLGLGVLFSQDKSSNTAMKSTQIQINSAYHLKLGKSQQFSSAIYLGYLGMNYDFDQSWASQHDGFAFNPALSSREENLRLNAHHIDAGFGFVHSIFQHNYTKKADIDPFLQVGAAFYHLGNSNNLQTSAPTKFVGNLQMNVVSFKNKILISPQIVYLKQGEFQKMQFGSMFSYLNNPKTKATGNFTNNTKNSFSMGVYYSLAGNLTTVLKISYKKFLFHFSYDRLLYSKNYSFSSNAFESGISFVIGSKYKVKG
jgi:type IX secretion system PorP/SprF family membrane protein